MPVGRKSVYDGDSEQPVLFEEYKEPPWVSEWRSMPEFIQQASEPFAELIVRFSSEYDFEEFQKLLDQKINSVKASIWHPKLIRGEHAKYRWTVNQESQSKSKS